MNKQEKVQEIPEVQGDAPERMGGKVPWVIPPRRISERIQRQIDRRGSRARYSSDANFGANSGADRRGSWAA